MANKPTDKQLAAARLKLQSIDRRHGQYMDEMLAAYEERLDAIIEKATAVVTNNVLRKVSTNDSGTVIRNPKTLAALNDLNTQFTDAMNASGYDRMSRNFVEAFPEQLPLMKETLEVISAAMVHPIDAGAIANPADDAALANEMRFTLAQLRDVVARVGLDTKRRALANVNGLTSQDFSTLLRKSFNVTAGQAEGLAATGMATFYRVANERALAAVEKETPLRYAYDGPHDVLNRDFCDHLKTLGEKGRTWSRAEIDAMDNGQIPGVFTSCGGYRCRHQWRVALQADAIAHHRVSQKVAGSELLNQQDARIFRKGSVEKGVFTFRAGSADKLATIQTSGVNYTFAPKNAPFGAGFYTSNATSDAGPNSARVVLHITKPLIGDWSKIKDEVGVIDDGLSPELTGSARARALRKAILRRGYDSVIAIRPNGSRVIVALKKGTAALVGPGVE